MSAVYSGDFFAWVNEQVSLLRSGRYAEVDIDHVVEELESVGRSEQRELINRMSVLLGHLLKWHIQPTHQCRSWSLTISNQRDDLNRLLKKQPSLRPTLQDSDWIYQAWRNATNLARDETGLDTAFFLENPPWSIEQALQEDFLP